MEQTIVQVATQFQVPIVAALCLCVGKIVKDVLPTDNKWIPVILGVVGVAATTAIHCGVDITFIVQGLCSASIAVYGHQVITQLVKNPKVGSGDNPTKAATLHEENDPADAEGEEING